MHVVIVAEFIEREAEKARAFVNSIQHGGVGGKIDTEGVRRCVRSKVTRKPVAVRWI